MASSDSSNPAQPAIRAVQTKNLLAALDEALTPAEAKALYARMDGNAIDTVRTALMLSWVPLELHMRLSTEVMEQVGREPFVDLFQSTFKRSLSAPMLRGLFGTLRRLSQDSIHTLFRNGPRLYGYLVREAGAVRYQRNGERSAHMFLEGWPPQYSTECWALGTQGCLRALLEAAHGGGVGASSIDLLDCDNSTGQITYRVDWS